MKPGSPVQSQECNSTTGTGAPARRCFSHPPHPAPSPQGSKDGPSACLCTGKKRLPAQICTDVFNPLAFQMNRNNLSLGFSSQKLKALLSRLKALRP